MSIGNTKVVIVGAGPYGLSTAAYLQAAGIEPYLIGQPMVFWKDQMPKGMCLRSGIEASNIASPRDKWSLAAYEKVIRRKLTEPLPIEDFVAYGEWFQKQVVSFLDTRFVQCISRNGSGLQLTMDDGEQIHAKSVVLTLGIGKFAYRPDQFAGISKELAPHSSDLSDLSRFKGKRVAVIGKGQSALEYAALLHEQRADVEIITRSPEIGFLRPRWRSHLFRRLTPGPLRPLSYIIRPPTDLGDFRTCRMIAHPDKFRRQSPDVQEALLKSVKKPIGSHWLRKRLKDVRVRTTTTVTKVSVVGNGLEFRLSDGSVERFDNVVLATGYKVDISQYPLLEESLKAEMLTEDGYPVLTTGLETSIPGLYMAGVIAERTLGPTLRFVTGTSNAGPRIAASIVRHQFARSPLTSLESREHVAG